MQGRIQNFKLGGGALKKIAPSGGRREHFGVFRVINHDFTPNAPGSAPGVYVLTDSKIRARWFIRLENVAFFQLSVAKFFSKRYLDLKDAKITNLTL